MAIKLDQLDRLQATLLTSGLSQKNQPLFQVVKTLIDTIRATANEVNKIESVTPSIINQVTVGSLMGMVTSDDIDFDIDGPGSFVGTALLDGTHNGGYVQRIP